MDLSAKKKMPKMENKIIKTFFIFLITASTQLSAISIDYKTKALFTKDCNKEKKQYLVTNVLDGDTITVAETKKIRFLGIDACEKDQGSCGMSAKDFLTMLISNQNVCIETDVQKKDIYGRTLGYVFSKDKLVNEELLKNGHALLSDFPPNIKYIDRLKKAQIYARKNMLGIWEKEDYIKETPSQFRHKTKH